MNSVQARKMVLAAIGFLLVVSLYKERTGRSDQGTYRTVWGVGVVGVCLSLLADFVPQIAGPFAGLVALGSLTHGGDKVIGSILGTVSGGPSSPGASGFTTEPSGHAPNVPVGPHAPPPGSGGFQP